METLLRDREQYSRYRAASPTDPRCESVYEVDVSWPVKPGGSGGGANVIGAGLKGGARVRAGGQKVAPIGDGHFVGEMSFVIGTAPAVGNHITMPSIETEEDTLNAP